MHDFPLPPPVKDDRRRRPGMLTLPFRMRPASTPAGSLVGGSRGLRHRRSERDENRIPLGPHTAAVCVVSLLAVLALVLYARIVASMAAQWWSDPNYGHGFIVPLFAGFVLWRERGRTMEVAVNASNWGFPIMLSAVALLIIGTLGSEHFTARLSMLLLISGMVVFLVGWQALRRVTFPITYLAFMIPLPAMIYYQLTFPLQLLASRLGAGGLTALGVPTVREGNLLILPNCTLEVVEACSGVRTLLSLLAAVVGYAYLAERSPWKRAVLLALTVPVVIVSNGLRLVSMGLLSFFVGPAADSGVAHTGLGLAFFALGFAFVVLVHSLLRRVSRAPAAAHGCHA